MMLSASIPARADFSVRPFVSEELLVNDNRRVRAAGGPTVIGSLSTAQLALNYSRPTWFATAIPRAKISRFTEDSSLNSEDYLLIGATEKRFEYLTIALNTQASSVSALTTELADIGLVLENKQQNRFSISPRVTYFATPTLQLGFSLNYVDVEFQNAENTALIDYSSYSFGPDVQYQFSENISFNSNFSVSEFKTPDTQRKTFSKSVNVGATYRYSEKLFVSASLGGRFNNIEQGFQALVPNPDFPNGPVFVIQDLKQEDTTKGILANVLVERTIERGTVSASYSRFVSPASIGIQQVNEEWGLNFEYEMSPRWTSEMEFEFANLKADGDDRTDQNERIRLRLKTVYAFSRNWYFDAGYTLRRVKFMSGGTQSSGSKAKSNEVFIALRYQGDNLRF